MVTVLHMELGGHILHGQLCYTISTHQPLALIHIVKVSLAGHLLPIRCGGFLPIDVPRMTHHLNRIRHIFSEPNPIKEAD